MVRPFASTVGGQLSGTRCVEYIPRLLRTSSPSSIMGRVIRNPLCTPHRPQGPRAPGAPRPRNCELSPFLRLRICETKRLGLGYKAIRRHLSNDEHVGLTPFLDHQKNCLKEPWQDE